VGAARLLLADTSNQKEFHVTSSARLPSHRVDEDAKPAAGPDGRTVVTLGAGAEKERALIERARQGDAGAFEQLVRLHQRRVLALLGHFVRPSADVEDLAQQVFLKVYLALPRFDFRSAFSTWLYRIAVNEAYDYLRRRRAQKSPAGTELAVDELAALEHLGGSVTQPEPPDVAAQTERRQLVEKLLARLPVDDRLVLTLRELEGMNITEIAEIMKLPENTVKVRLFRARARLAEAYRRLLRAQSR
jgi:RNA polymerase sigma-70 factor (ECF subfamily)